MTSNSTHINFRGIFSHLDANLTGAMPPRGMTGKTGFPTDHAHLSARQATSETSFLDNSTNKVARNGYDGLS